jgi:hypothetical protein
LLLFSPWTRKGEGGYIEGLLAYDIECRPKSKCVKKGGEEEEEEEVEEEVEEDGGGKKDSQGRAHKEQPF